MAQILKTTSDYIVGLTDDYTSSNSEPPLLQSKREQDLLFSFRKLSEKDKIRVEERILTLLDKE